jgi:uncharacterized protein YndB with AHSA1/START domain
MRRVLAVAVLAIACANTGVHAEHRPLSTGAFEVTHNLLLPGTPEQVFDAVTGDISGWWDHTFSGDPLRLHIEPKPGGGFWEIFDEEGNGVLHATVTAAERGKLLRFEGSLGLAGNAIRMVHTYEFTKVDLRTNLRVTVRAAGQMEEDWAEAVDGVWSHFLFERLKPYIESGKHLE